jgi:hypothetical protein
MAIFVSHVLVTLLYIWEDQQPQIVRPSLHRAIWALEHPAAAARNLQNALLTKHVVARQELWWVVCCALVPADRAREDAAVHKLLPEFNLKGQLCAGG